MIALADVDELVNEFSDLSMLEDEFEIHLDKGEYETVISKCNEREKEFPKDQDVFYYRGLAYFHMKNYEKAKSNFEELINIDPTWEISIEEYIDIINNQSLTNGSN